MWIKNKKVDSVFSRLTTDLFALVPSTSADIYDVTVFQYNFSALTNY